MADAPGPSGAVRAPPHSRARSSRSRATSILSRRASTVSPKCRVSGVHAASRSSTVRWAAATSCSRDIAASRCWSHRRRGRRTEVDHGRPAGGRSSAAGVARGLASALVRPFLLLASRPEDEAADDEYAAFLRATGLDEGRLRRIRLEAAPLPELDLDDYAEIGRAH